MQHLFIRHTHTHNKAAICIARVWTIHSVRLLSYLKRKNKCNERPEDPKGKTIVTHTHTQIEANKKIKENLTTNTLRTFRDIYTYSISWIRKSICVWGMICMWHHPQNAHHNSMRSFKSFTHEHSTANKSGVSYTSHTRRAKKSAKLTKINYVIISVRIAVVVVISFI